MLTVFFDLDGTLLKNKEQFPAVFARVLRDLGLERSPADAEMEIRTCWPWYEANVGQYRGREFDLWLGFNTRVCDALGAGDQAQGAGIAVTASFREMDHPTLWEDALPCLDALSRAGYTLGVITARPDAVRVLEPLGVTDRFRYLIDAFASGSAKQDAASFEFALRTAGIEADTAVHVGDQVERDILPAQAVGLTPVLIDRSGRFPEATFLRIEDLEELPALIAGLEA